MPRSGTYHASPRARQKRSDASLETALGAIFILIVAMPIVAVVAGLSWRLFTWIAG